jgi:hypothetical protein
MRATVTVGVDRRHLDSTFDEFGFSVILHRSVAPFELVARKAVAVLKGRDRRSRGGWHGHEKLVVKG